MNLDKIFYLLTSFLLTLGLNGQEKKIDFHQEIEPLLAKYCYQCHGPEKQKSGVRIDTMNPDMLKGEHGGKWREILDAIDRGDMPPDDEPLPSDPERELISEWMSSELDRSAKALRSTGGHVTLRRLTGYEYTNTMKDLLGVDLDFSKNLPPDTLIYCGHEYTEKNGEFAISIDDQNKVLKEKIKNVASKIEQGLPSIPVSLKEELDTNIFLRCENEKIKSKLQMHNASKLEVFTKLRNLKDQF